MNICICERYTIAHSSSLQSHILGEYIYIHLIMCEGTVEHKIKVYCVTHEYNGMSQYTSLHSDSEHNRIF